MSDLTFNKIAGAVLATGLAIFFLREVSDVVFHSEEPEKAGYAIAVQEDTGGGGGSGPELPPDWGTVIPVANIQAGQQVAQKCISCHTFDAGGANGTGPNLYGTMGKKPGSHAGFSYSSAMVEYGATHPVWGWDNMNEFLTAPQKHVPGTKMTFVGLKKVEDRIAILAYLHSLGSTLPIPAPNPVAPEADAAPAEGAAAEGEPTTTEAAPAALPGGPSDQTAEGLGQGSTTQTPAQTPAKPQKPTG